jgi:hypothetical protein
LALQGYASLIASVNHTFDNALGFVTEVFSGYQNIPPQEGVPHQGFCTAGVVLPFVRGMLGLDGSALERSVTFAPQFPADWDAVDINGYRLGNAQFSFSVRRADKSLILIAGSSVASSPGYQLHYAPALGIGTRIVRVTVNGRDTPFAVERGVQSIQPVIQFPLIGEMRCEITFEPVAEILPPEPLARTGEGNQGLKLISTEWSNRTLRVVMEGLAGKTYRLRLRNAALVTSVQEGRLEGDEIVIGFPAGAPGEFLRKEVTIKM